MSISLRNLLMAFGLGAALATTNAFAFGWNDVKNAADDVAHGFEKGWERFEDSVQTESAEEKREEAAEARSEAAEKAKDGRTGKTKNTGT